MILSKEFQVKILETFNFSEDIFKYLEKVSNRLVFNPGTVENGQKKVYQLGANIYNRQKEAWECIHSRSGSLAETIELCLSV